MIKGQEGTTFLSSKRISVFCSEVNSLTFTNLLAIIIISEQDKMVVRNKGTMSFSSIEIIY